MDVGLISFVLAQLAVQWNTTGMELSWIASAGFVGMAVGAVLGGLLADRIGRRQVFALTLLVYGVATGASALSGSVAVLIAWRFLVGLGLGAELPVARSVPSDSLRNEARLWQNDGWRSRELLLTPVRVGRARLAQNSGRPGRCRWSPK